MSGKQSVAVRYQEIVDVARQIKQGSYQQVYLTIDDVGHITGSWFFGRSDFVLRPGFIVLPRLLTQSEESIVYAIFIAIRNQEGYYVSEWPKEVQP